LKEKHAKSPWKNVLYTMFATEEFQTALFQLYSDLEAKQMFTPFLKIFFRNLELCNPNAVSTVFITAYPYYHKGQADGLAFSSQTEGAVSAEGNTFHDTLSEISVEGPKPDYNLEYLVEQGVLLWNISLTAPIGKQTDHYPMWEPVSRMFFDMLSKYMKNIIFVFVGEPADKMGTAIHKGNGHLKIFLPEIPAEGNWNHIDSFNTINAMLAKQKKHPIIW